MPVSHGITRRLSRNKKRARDARKHAGSPQKTLLESATAHTIRRYTRQKQYDKKHKRP